MTFYIGPAGIPNDCKVRSSEAGVKRVAELGLNLMEVEFVHGVNMGIEEAEKIGRLAESLGVKLSCHGPYFINLNAIEEGKVTRSRQHILATAKIADVLGAHVIAFHAGFYLGMDAEQVSKKIKAELGDIAATVEKNGWEVSLGLETTGKHSAWGTIDEIIAVSRDFKNIVPVIDFAHIYARTGGGLKTSSDFEALMKKYDTLKPTSLHSHFSGIKYSEKGELRHLTFEETKEPDFAKLAPVLKKRDYDISIVCESPDLEVDALKMKKMLGL